MAFLAANVFCAAAIRYPWAKRQTGFVITHVGLLIVIGGSWYAAQTSDEGLLKLVEGETSGELIQMNKSVVYVRPVDPHTGKALGTYKLPLRPGAFDWAPGSYEVISKPEDPFKLAIKGFYAASIPRDVVVAGRGGRPMLEIRPTIIPPGQTVPQDVFASEADRWVAVRTDRPVPSILKLGRPGPAKMRVSRAERPDIFDDFLTPPADPGLEGVARLHYIDRAGKPRQLDVRLDDARVGEPIALPDSDLAAALRKYDHQAIDEPEQQEMFGSDMLDVVEFDVRKGDAPPLTHPGYGNLPGAPAVLPKRDDATGVIPTPLLTINYYCPPVIDPKVNGQFGLIDLMLDANGRMAYRVFERGNPGKLRSHGPLQLHEAITAFGGNSVAPMTLAFEVERYLPSAQVQTIAESISPEPNERDNALGAVLAELTVKGVTREVWLRKSADYGIHYKPLAVDDSLYELAFDAERLPLGFSLTLKDFDVVFDPGTDKAAGYRSEVTLTDEPAKIRDRPESIFMNHTLDHNGWRFFQTSYFPVTDERNRPTGEFGSVLQVARNPAREVIYGGCLIVVFGAFVQFYMRAGVFTDGGKREREKAADNARRRLEAKQARLRPEPTRPAADDFEPL